MQTLSRYLPTSSSLDLDIISGTRTNEAMESRKRSFPDDRRYDRDESNKKRRDDSSRPHHQHSRRGDDRRRHDRRDERRDGPVQRGNDTSSSSSTLMGHQEALSKLPPSTAAALTEVPAYRAFRVADDLPALPQLSEALRDAPFRHKSRHGSTLDRTDPTMTYEQLEFLGDAYIELIASRLIFDRFPHLLAGEQSQLRELLVKNETLAEYSRAYGFEKKEDMVELNSVIATEKKGNKGFTKILGDVFEAYAAAVALSDVENGFSVLEKWLVTLWAPKLAQAAQKDPRRVGLHFKLERDGPLYDPAAKVTLLKRLSPFGRLVVETSRPTVELKGDKLGQNINYVNLHLTCFEHEKVLLAEGEGRNKKEAANVAAQKAMEGEMKQFIDDLEKRVQAQKSIKKEQKEREDEAKKANGNQSNGNLHPNEVADV